MLGPDNRGEKTLSVLAIRQLHSHMAAGQDR
ncbi:hypothetical protein SAMN06296065_102114 [Novosphingobium panipatense]|jgi:hypothetical protein|uniref:Uncharacterized protein n=1 Tax=Novosphingobium panipatense TaxID=428991 RepID=A0ABY1Q1J4_9SPHN|nr:hypothetical protein SAMN06296065_102114 [Novosphingobium panipatense]